jgi:two-component system chemotaxis sensor kinase CheA
MDVVVKNIEALRGTLTVESELGRGTTFTMRLPLTVAVIDGFSVSAAAQTYVVPLDAVRECIELPGVAAETSRIVGLHGHALPFFRLRDVLGLRGSPATRESLLVLEHDKARVGVVVDELLGAGPVVVKPKGKLLAGSMGLAGSTILGNGRVAFLLDVPGLLRLASGALGMAGPQGGENARA